MLSHHWHLIREIDKTSFKSTHFGVKECTAARRGRDPKVVISHADVDLRDGTFERGAYRVWRGPPGIHMAVVTIVETMCDSSGSCSTSEYL